MPIISVNRRINETGETFPDEETLVYLTYDNITDEDTSINLFLRDFFEKDYKKVKNPTAKEILSHYKESREGNMFIDSELQKIIDEKTAEIQKQAIEFKTKYELAEEKHKEDQEKIRELENLLKEVKKDR